MAITNKKTTKARMKMFFRNPVVNSKGNLENGVGRAMSGMPFMEAMEAINATSNTMPGNDHSEYNINPIAKGKETKMFSAALKT